MAGLMRVALPGYDASTDTNPDHFALLSDEDWVLIKEFTRGSDVVVSGNSKTITHSLGYIPLVMVYTRSGDIWSILSGESVEVTSTTLKIFSNNGTQFKYYIFYDNQV
jgi:hypothetical protein